MNCILVFYRFIWRFYINFVFWQLKSKLNLIELIQNRIRKKKYKDKNITEECCIIFPSFSVFFLEITMPIKIWNIFQFLDYTDMTSVQPSTFGVLSYLLMTWTNVMRKFWEFRAQGNKTKVLCSSVSPTIKTQWCRY